MIKENKNNIEQIIKTLKSTVVQSPVPVIAQLNPNLILNSSKKEHDK